MKEIWKDIKGYEGLYQVSNLGNIFSNRKNKYVHSSIHKNGYATVILTKEGKRDSQLVHRLVAESFIPNQDNKPCVDHINTVRNDNRVENLRWTTYSENCLNPITRKRQSESSMGDKNARFGKKPWNYGVPQTEEQRKKNSEVHKGIIYPSKRKGVIQIKEDGSIKEWNTTSEAKADGYSQGRISYACNGNHKYKKSIWYFKSDYEQKILRELESS